MQIEINGEVKNVPGDISEISLGTYIEWFNQYGRELDEHLQKILIDEYHHDEVLKEILIDQHLDDEAVKWYSFFTGADFISIADEPMMLPVLEQYKTLRYMLKISEAESYELPKEVDWNGDTWLLQDWKVDAQSNFSFNEIITSKEVMRQIHKLGLGKWDALPYLSAIFFRKKGESFSDGLIHEGCERLQLMQTLPLNHAFSIAFFLTSCVDTLKNTSAFLNPEEVVKQSLR